MRFCRKPRKQSTAALEFLLAVKLLGELMSALTDAVDRVSAATVTAVAELDAEKATAAAQQVQADEIAQAVASLNAAADALNAASAPAAPVA